MRLPHSDLSRFIANGRLACTIDKVSGVITTTKTSAENKTVAYEQVVKQGDILLNGKHRIDTSCVGYLLSPKYVRAVQTSRS